MWKECKNFNSYLVSDEGEVKHKTNNKILKQKLDKDNYLNVSLSMGSRNNIKHRFVHRLVAEAFIPNPENKPLVRHKDGDSINNCADNLEWVTYKENIEYSKKAGLKPDDHGSASPNSKLTMDQIIYCRNLYKPRDKKYSCQALAKQFGVSKSTMSYILRNVTYIPSSSKGRT